MLKSDDLIATARYLATRTRTGRPNPADICRAISTSYYAVFHELARDCADLVLNQRARSRTRRAWSQVYRALDHRRIKDACRSQNSRIRNAWARFPAGIRDFGDSFCALQDKRHKADYDPLAIFSRADAINTCDEAERAIVGYRSVPTGDRRAFVVFVAFDLRP